MSESIYILIHSLKYHPDVSRAQIVSRENFARVRAEKNPDELIERVSPAKFFRESRAIEREQSRLWYDQQIRKNTARVRNKFGCKLLLKMQHGGDRQTLRR